MILIINIFLISQIIGLLFWNKKQYNVLGFNLAEIIYPTKPYGHYASLESTLIDVPVSPCTNGFGCLQQIGGLVPMADYTGCESCREYTDPLCFKNIVFADITAPTEDYKNDKSYFLFNGVEDSANVTIVFQLQFLLNGSWIDVGTPNDTALGDFIDQGDYTDFPEYTGFNIDWLKVFQEGNDVGYYRLKVDSTLYGDNCIQYSEEFLLRIYDCDLADLTVRFETMITNKFANQVDNQKEFDLCGIEWVDSVRLPGEFRLIIPEFEEKYIKYQSSGFQKQIRRQTIYNYEFKMGDIPQKYWDRLVAYGFSANELFISDYNIHNSDYNIIDKPIMFNSITELSKADDHTRLLRAKITFKDRYQNNLKSNCC